MATPNLVVCNADFDWAGIAVHKGDIYSSTHIFYSKFPAKFDLQQPFATGGIATALTGGTLGSIVAGKLPVTDANGSVVGLMPLYNTISGT